MPARRKSHTRRTRRTRRTLRTRRTRGGALPKLTQNDASELHDFLIVLQGARPGHDLAQAKLLGCYIVGSANIAGGEGMLLGSHQKGLAELIKEAHVEWQQSGPNTQNVNLSDPKEKAAAKATLYKLAYIEEAAKTLRKLVAAFDRIVDRNPSQFEDHQDLKTIKGQVVDAMKEIDSIMMTLPL